jgi:hypothetical protein
MPHEVVLVPLGNKISLILQSGRAERGVRQKGKLACHRNLPGLFLGHALGLDALYFRSMNRPEDLLRFIRLACL